jgi:hypothetical protein
MDDNRILKIPFLKGRKMIAMFSALSVGTGWVSFADLAFALSVDPAARLMVVDCQLPGQVRRLGRRVTFIGPRRAIRTPASECEIRGGEYVAFDRADYRSALQAWMPSAAKGDPRAQTYVGEIAEKGLGQLPNFPAAAEWYAKAAAQGYSPAMVNLARLYLEGIGVTRDPQHAELLLRQAARLPPDLAAVVRFGVLETSGNGPALDQDLARGNSDLDRLRTSNGALSMALDGQRQEVARLTAALERERADLLAERASLSKARAGDDVTGRNMREQLEANLAAAELSLAARATELAAIRRGTADTIKTQAASANSRIASLEKQLVVARTERDAARTAAQVQASTLASREQSLAQRDAALQAQERRLAELRAATERARALPPPAIALMEPQISATRGDRVIVLPATASMRTIIGQVSAPAGLVGVTVNGQRQMVLNDMMFQTDLKIDTARLPVEIVAIDKLGRRAAITFELRRDSSTPTAAASAPPMDWSEIRTARPHALLVGNMHYTNVTSLKTPIADVDTIAALLRERYGFEVTVLHDATRYQILSALNRLRQELTNQDDLLLYYAGHGQTVTAGNRDRGYWVPVDAEEQSTANWISTTDITDILATMAVRKILVVADSCYSGLLTRSSLERLAAGASTAAQQDYFRTIALQKSRNVLTSGGNVPVLDEGGGMNSVFARALIMALRDNNGPMQGQDLARLVQQAVAYAAHDMDFEQVPQYAPLSMAGHESGDFVFLPRRPADAATAR